MAQRIHHTHHLVPSFFILLLLAFCQSRSYSQDVILSGYEDFLIPLQNASQLVKNFQKSVAPGSLLAKYYSMNDLKLVLAQPDCVGVRIYYAKNSDGSPTLVIVGVDSHNNDMVNGPLIDTGYPCPPFCDTVHIVRH